MLIISCGLCMRMGLYGYISGMSHRILVIEDNGALRFALQVMLENEPDVEQVETVPSGERALQIATELQPDVVVTDTGLPGLSGEEVAGRIRKLFPDTRIVSFTGNDKPAPWADEQIVKASSYSLESLRAAVGRGGISKGKLSA